MSRLSDNDKKWGPFTLGTWFKQFGFYYEVGEESGKNRIMLIGFKRCLRILLPRFLKAFGLRYGIVLNGEDGSVGSSGYDSVTLYYGPNEHWDSSKCKSWRASFPWKRWRHVRYSCYRPDGSHFFTEGPKGWSESYQKRQECPKVFFKIEDFDGTELVATCYIEEREWRRGEEPFEWLRHFYPPMIHRTLDITLDGEMGSEKGSWKGGTIGTSCEMLEGDTPESAFRRWCDKDQRGRGGRTYRVKFIGPCEPKTAILHQ